MVPLDYANPNGGWLQLGVVRFPATDAQQRIGVLLVNPGGPGVSGVDFLNGAIGALSDLNTRFDLVSWDPRGDAQPDSVHCETTRDLDAFVAADPIADDPAEHSQLLQVSHELASACSNGRPGQLLPHLGTADTVQDMDALRAALGESQFSYLGFSYGTRYGTFYAEEFPAHVRAMAFDGVVDPSLDAMSQAHDQADAFEASFDYLDSWCDTDSACPLYPDARGRIDAILTQLDTAPVTLNGRTYTRGDALEALVGMMYNVQAWPYLLNYWLYAGNGHFDALQYLTDVYTGRSQSGFDPSLEAGTATDCLDSEVPTSTQQIDQVARTAEARDPHFGDAAVYGWLPCSYWAVRGPVAAPVRVTGVPPVLLVSGTGDPATPYQWGTSLQHQIEGSVLLTRVGHGHPSYFQNSCVRTYVNEYLASVTPPPPGTTCYPG